MSVPVIELRQYTVDPDHRDELLEMYDTEFTPAQRALGIGIPGVFADTDHPDRIVWWRTFDDLDTRGDMLRAFYSSSTWMQHGVAFNDHLIDYSNALLLAHLTGPLEALEAPEPITIIPALPAEIGTPRQGLAAPQDGLTLGSIAAPNDYPRLPLRTDTNLVIVGSPPDLDRPHDTVRITGRRTRQRR